MTMYFSKTKGFIDETIFEKIPKDAVALTDEQYLELMDGQYVGKNIKVDKKGFPQLVDRPALTADQIFKMYEGALEELLKDIAQKWGYSSIIDAVSYINSTNKQYKAEAEALIEWRDKCWSKAYTIQAEALPSSVEDFLKLLPAVPKKPAI